MGQSFYKDRPFCKAAGVNSKIYLYVIRLYTYVYVRLFQQIRNTPNLRHNESWIIVWYFSVRDIRYYVKRRESSCPRYVVTVAVRKESRVRLTLVCGQKLLFPYKAPLSRTILLEWLREMPNRELGIAVSSAVVSSDHGKNSFATLSLATSVPLPFL